MLSGSVQKKENEYIFVCVHIYNMKLHLINNKSKETKKIHNIMLKEPTIL